MSPLQVVYDISVLGSDPAHQQAWTGVHRVVLQTAAGVLSSAECEVQLCAAESFLKLKRVLNYLSSNPAFGRVNFIRPEWQSTHGFAAGLAEKILAANLSGHVSLPGKVARRLRFYALRFLESFCHRFAADEFPAGGIFHSPFYALPDRSKMPARLTRFLTVYDLIPILAPQYMNNDKNHFLHHTLRTLKPDDWAISISEATKGELCEYLKFDPERVFVAHPAASPALFHRDTDADGAARVREKYGIPDAPYILSLNTLEPRKNIDHSIRCFARAVREGKLSDLHFVLVGARGWDYGKIFDALADQPELKDRIILTGYAKDEDLAALYSGALAFVYMSFYEGFGLPPLEAMLCGVPVVTSNTSSLPEVVGDAGIMLDPRDADGLCESIQRLYADAALRATLSARSLARSELFSWERCTLETIAAYKVARGN